MREATFEEVFTEAGILPKWIAQAETKARAEEKTEVARNLLTLNIPVEIISQAVQMPIEEVCALSATMTN